MRSARRFLLLIVGLAVASIASADLTEVDVDNTYFSGQIFMGNMPNPTTVSSQEGGGSMNFIPVSYALTRKSNIQYSGGFTTQISIEQTKIYVVETNRFMPITARTIVDLSANKPSKVANSDAGTNGVQNSVDGVFFQALANAPFSGKPEYMYGKYRLRFQVSTNSGASYTDLMSLEWVMSPIGLRDANLDGGSNPNGGGITPGDLNGQNVNQGGFWQGLFDSLFVPSGDTVNNLKEACGLWAQWGPFGIITYLHDRSEEYSSQQQLDYSFTVPLPMVGSTVFDLTPWSAAIKIGRAIGAMGVWLMLILGVSRLLRSKV